MALADTAYNMYIEQYNEQVSWTQKFVYTLNIITHCIILTRIVFALVSNHRPVSLIFNRRTHPSVTRIVPLNNGPFSDTCEVWHLQERGYKGTHAIYR